MKNFNKFFLTNIYLLFFSTISFADNKIGYIDVDFILTKSIPSKSFFSQLKKIEESMLLQYSIRFE